MQTKQNMGRLMSLRQVNMLKTDYDSKISDIESEIPNITGLATSTAFTAVENKIPNISNLVRKANSVAKLKLRLIVINL